MGCCKHEKKPGATLLVLAAGMGSRFGGLKQVEGLGPGGEVILEYSVYDAYRAGGFTHFVFVIRREIEADFRAQVLARFPEDLDYSIVYQELDALPKGVELPTGRTKPWGTAHAVWCAREALRTPFAVINADDFYGRGAFESLGTFLRAAQAPGEWCMVGYELPRTLSEQGYVSRGVCETSAEGYLLSIVEHTKIQREGHRIVDTEAPGKPRELAEDTIVSMNCWGFTLDFLDFLDGYMGAFFRDSAGELKAECYLPSAVYAALQAGKASCRVIPTASQWYGVTYLADSDIVREALRAKQANGEYSEGLWHC